MRAMNVAPLALCVVIPVLNERDNVAPLVARLDATLAGIGWEAIFVDDDSTDGTRDAVRAVAAGDPRVRLLHRIGRRGLSSAFIEGAQASLAPCIAAIDGDMQHDERLLPNMLAALKADKADVVVGSRYLGGAGSDASALGATREAGSRLANWLGQRVLHARLTDPMRGFFMIRRELIEGVAGQLATSGFKVLFRAARCGDRGTSKQQKICRDVEADSPAGFAGRSVAKGQIATGGHQRAADTEFCESE